MLSTDLQTYQPIGLDEMTRVSLMNRIDTKFFFPVGRLPGILSQASPYYRVLEIGTDRIFTYRNLYFDTHDFQFYLSHHNGRLNRYKVRFREYVESRNFFLEIKFKSNTGRTIKKRMETEGLEEVLSENSAQYIMARTPFHPGSMQARLKVNFRRITLVHKINPERLTLDTALSFAWNGQAVELSMLAITEVKQGDTSIRSDFMHILKNQGIFPERISKYCTGMALLYPELKHNRFKEKLLSLEKIQNHERSTVHPQR